MTLKRAMVLAVSTLTFTMAGCTTYYKISDPAGTKEYYTTDVETTKAGAIRFTDEKTGAEVTLQSSEVKKIPHEEFEAAVKGEQGKK